jgi:hypothetical protein
MTPGTGILKVGGVSITGFSHLEEDIPCQDAHAFKIKDQSRIIAAIADGAGSARLSHIGAQAFVDAVVNRLFNLPISHNFDQERVASETIMAVNDTREQLLRHGAHFLKDENPSLNDFAATLLITVADPDGGAFFHVGDGAGAAFTHNCNDQPVTVSRPHNGEYANETYFVTMENWERYLRQTPLIAPYDTVLLMSDGVTPMAMAKGCTAPANNFATPVVKFLLNNGCEAGAFGVTNTLSSDNVRKITGDDKTLVWGLRTPN